MLCGLGRQMRTAVTALSSTPTPVKVKPKVLHRSVVPIKGSKTGRVAASILAHRDIAAMRMHEAKDRLIEGVPYVRRRQGYKALAAHINTPQKSGGRFSLPCNTGPRGSGKTPHPCHQVLGTTLNYLRPREVVKLNPTPRGLPQTGPPGQRGPSA